MSGIFGKISVGAPKTAGQTKPVAVPVPVAVAKPVSEPLEPTAQETQFYEECAFMARAGAAQFTAYPDTTQHKESVLPGVFPGGRTWLEPLVDTAALGVIVKGGMMTALRHLSGEVAALLGAGKRVVPLPPLRLRDLPFAVLLTVLEAATREVGSGDCRQAVLHWCDTMDRKLLTIKAPKGRDGVFPVFNVPSVWTEQAINEFAGPELQKLWADVPALARVWLVETALGTLRAVFNNEPFPSARAVDTAWAQWKPAQKAPREEAPVLVASEVLGPAPETRVQEDASMEAPAEAPAEAAAAPDCEIIEEAPVEAPVVPVGELVAAVPVEVPVAPADELVAVVPVEAPEEVSVVVPVVVPVVVQQQAVASEPEPEPSVQQVVGNEEEPASGVLGISPVKGFLEAFAQTLQQLRARPQHQHQDTASFLTQARRALEILLGGAGSEVDPLPVQTVAEFAKQHAIPSKFPLVSPLAMERLHVAAEKLAQELAQRQDLEVPSSTIDKLWLEFTSLQLHHVTSSVILKPAPRPGCNLRDVLKDVDTMTLATGPVAPTFVTHVGAMKDRVGASVVAVLRSGGVSSATVEAAGLAFERCMAELRSLGTGAGAGAGAGTGVRVLSVHTNGHSGGSQEGVVAHRPVAVVPAATAKAVAVPGPSAAPLVDPTSKLGMAVTVLSQAEGTQALTSLDPVDGFEFVPLIIGNTAALAAGRHTVSAWTLQATLRKCVLNAFCVASNLQPFLPLGVLGRMAMFYVKYLPNTSTERFSAANPFQEVKLDAVTAAASAATDPVLKDALKNLERLVILRQKVTKFKSSWMPLARVDFLDRGFQAGLVAAAVLANGPTSDLQRAAVVYLKENSGARKSHTPRLPTSAAFAADLKSDKHAERPGDSLDPELVKALVLAVCAKAGFITQPKRRSSGQDGEPDYKRTKQSVVEDEDDDDAFS